MWGEIMDGFEGKEQDFKLNTKVKREPGKLVKGRGGVVRGGCSGEG